MHALSQTRYGNADQLALVPLHAPTPKANELLIDVFASAVTQGDRRIRTGEFPGITFIPGRLAIGLRGPRHRTPGTSFAGRVVACGDAVSGFRVGDRVFGSTMHGAHATQLCVSADGPVTHTPEGVSDAEAAALVYGGVTAVSFLCSMAKVSSGERVLILGASGGVGRVAVQLAKALGAQVTAVCSEAHAPLARRCGADVVIDYRRGPSFEDGTHYDVVLDTIGVSSFRRAKPHLRVGGRYLSLIMTARGIVDALVTMRGERRAFVGAALGSREVMDTLAAFMARGSLRAHIAGRFPLHAGAAAHQWLDRGNPGGELVIEVRSDEAANRGRPRLRSADERATASPCALRSSAAASPA